MPTIQNLQMFASESRTFTLTARDQSNVTISLSNATIEWRVGKGPYGVPCMFPQFTKTASITDPANGVFQATLSAGDTQWLESGDWHHQSWATISGQTYVVNSGRLRIKSAIEDAA